MKLARIAKPLCSQQVRVTLAGDRNAALESYARSYQHVHGNTVDPKALIPEIVAAFLQADREFHFWARPPEHSQSRRVTAPASSNGSIKGQS